MLNFDPYRWLAERQDEGRSVATVATVATPNARNALSSLQGVPATPATPATKQVETPAATLKRWHMLLAPLDDSKPPDRLCPVRWRQLVRDSWWIYEHYASRAVREGWSDLDLFGVAPDKPGFGGLCDRLAGARNLKVEGPRAIWSQWGVTGRAYALGHGGYWPTGIVSLWVFRDR